MALTRPRYSQIYDTDWKQSVRLATTADVGNLFLANLQPNTVDSVSLSVNDRILVKDQNRPFENGIYIVRSVGTGSNGWWTRTLDAAQSNFVTSGLSAVVSEGTVNGGQEFRLITPDPITLDSTHLTFINQTGTPGGANTQVQFSDNIGGLVRLSGNPGFTYNKTSNAVSIAGNLTAGNLTVGAISASTLDVAGGGLNAVAIGQSTPAAGDFTRLAATGTVYANATTNSTSLTTGALIVAGGAAIASNVFFGGNLVSGNVTAPYFFGNGSQLSGVITSVTKIINGNAQVQSYPSGNISVTPGGIANVVVFATQPVGTTANASMHVSGDIQFTGNLYQNGNLFTSGSGTSPFSTVFSSNFGLITGQILTSEDQGNLLSAVSYTYDLGTIPYTQPVAPSHFTLPSYTVSTLPNAITAGQMIFVTNESGGSVPAFSDGTNWRRVTDRAIVS